MSPVASNMLRGRVKNDNRSTGYGSNSGSCSTIALVVSFCVLSCHVSIHTSPYFMKHFASSLRDCRSLPLWVNMVHPVGVWGCPALVHLASSSLFFASKGEEMTPSTSHPVATNGGRVHPLILQLLTLNTITAAMPL